MPPNKPAKSPNAGLFVINVPVGGPFELQSTVVLLNVKDPLMLNPPTRGAADDEPSETAKSAATQTDL